MFGRRAFLCVFASVMLAPMLPKCQGESALKNILHPLSSCFRLIAMRLACCVCEVGFRQVFRQVPRSLSEKSIFALVDRF